MRLALVIYGALDVRSGGNYYDQRLVARLRSSGHDVEEISLPPAAWGRSFLRGLRSDSLVSRLSGDWDLLLEDELTHPSLWRVNRRLRELSEVPNVSIVHHLRSSERHPRALLWLYRVVERAYLRTVEAFLFNSSNTRRQVESLLGHPVVGLVAHPGGDRLGEPAPSNTTLRPGEPLRLVFVGNLIRRKNLEVVLRAMAHGRFPSTLEVLGETQTDSRYVEQLRRIAGELGLEERVHFRGSVGDRELVEHLGCADVLVAPSSWEGFGIVYLEGMAFGLPAIASRAGAAHEVIDDGVTGFLVEPDDVETISRLLDRLAGDRELLERMSVAARREFLRRPGWDETMESVEAWLVEHVEQGPSRARKRARSAA